MENILGISRTQLYRLQKKYLEFGVHYFHEIHKYRLRVMFTPEAVDILQNRTRLGDSLKNISPEQRRKNAQQRYKKHPNPGSNLGGK